MTYLDILNKGIKDITMTEFKILTQCVNDNFDREVVSKKLGITYTWISIKLRSLIEKGYVKRSETRNVVNSLTYNYSLTERGRAIFGSNKKDDFNPNT